MFDATPCMRREPIASTRACSTASNRARAGGLCGARRRWSASLWQASRRANESARPRTIAASRGLGLRGGSGSRALAPSGEVISEGLSAEKAISSSGLARQRPRARCERLLERLVRPSRLCRRACGCCWLDVDGRHSGPSKVNGTTRAAEAFIGRAPRPRQDRARRSKSPLNSRASLSEAGRRAVRAGLEPSLAAFSDMDWRFEGPCVVNHLVQAHTCAPLSARINLSM